MSEAFNLLNKSIIRVEQPDVNLDDNEDDDLNKISETNGNIKCYFLIHFECTNNNDMLFRNGC